MLLILGGLVMAVIAAVLVMNVTTRAKESAAQVKQVQVVVATQDIPQGTEITAAMLQVKPFPADFAPQESIANLRDAVGRYSASNVVKGQLITAPLLSTTKQAGNMANSIPKGMVAYPLPASDLLTANGAIQPGDRVDVLATLHVKMIVRKGSGDNTDESDQPTTQTMLQNLQVLDVLGQSSSGTGASAVVLLVTPQQAVTLKLAKDSGGTLDLALRPANDSGKIVVTAGQTIDSEITNYKFRKPQPIR